MVCVGKLCIGERIGNLKLVDMNKKSKKKKENKGIKEE